MAIKLETNTIRTMAVFEEVTNVHPRDCLISEDFIYFLVDPKKIGLAIGRNGSVANTLRKTLGKSVKIFGYADTPEDMMRNLIPCARSIEINEQHITVSVPPEERVGVIGRNGSHIKAIKEILMRHFSIKNLRLK